MERASDYIKKLKENQRLLEEVILKAINKKDIQTINDAIDNLNKFIMQNLEVFTRTYNNISDQFNSLLSLNLMFNSVFNIEKLYYFMVGDSSINGPIEHKNIRIDKIANEIVEIFNNYEEGKDILSEILKTYERITEKALNKYRNLPLLFEVNEDNVLSTIFLANYKDHNRNSIAEEYGTLAIYEGYASGSQDSFIINNENILEKTSYYTSSLFDYWYSTQLKFQASNRNNKNIRKLIDPLSSYEMVKARFELFISNLWEVFEKLTSGNIAEIVEYFNKLKNQGTEVPKELRLLIYYLSSRRAPEPYVDEFISLFSSFLIYYPQFYASYFFEKTYDQFTKFITIKNQLEIFPISYKDKKEIYEQAEYLLRQHLDKYITVLENIKKSCEAQINFLISTGKEKEDSETVIKYKRWITMYENVKSFYDSKDYTNLYSYLYDLAYVYQPAIITDDSLTIKDIETLINEKSEEERNKFINNRFKREDKKYKSFSEMLSGYKEQLFLFVFDTLISLYPKYYDIYASQPNKPNKASDLLNIKYTFQNPLSFFSVYSNFLYLMLYSLSKDVKIAINNKNILKSIKDIENTLTALRTKHINTISVYDKDKVLDNIKKHNVTYFQYSLPVSLRLLFANSLVSFMYSFFSPDSMSHRSVILSLSSANEIISSLKNILDALSNSEKELGIKDEEVLSNIKTIINIVECQNKNAIYLFKYYLFSELFLSVSEPRYKHNIKHSNDLSYYGLFLLDNFFYNLENRSYTDGDTNVQLFELILKAFIHIINNNVNNDTLDEENLIKDLDDFVRYLKNMHDIYNIRVSDVGTQNMVDRVKSFLVDKLGEEFLNISLTLEDKKATSVYRIDNINYITFLTNVIKNIVDIKPEICEKAIKYLLLSIMYNELPKMINASATDFYYGSKLFFSIFLFSDSYRTENDILKHKNAIDKIMYKIKVFIDKLEDDKKILLRRFYSLFDITEEYLLVYSMIEDLTKSKANAELYADTSQNLMTYLGMKEYPEIREKLVLSVNKDTLTSVIERIKNDPNDSSYKPSYKFLFSDISVSVFENSDLDNSKELVFGRINSILGKDATKEMKIGYVKSESVGRYTIVRETFDFELFYENVANSANTVKDVYEQANASIFERLSMLLTKMSMKDKSFSKLIDGNENLNAGDIVSILASLFGKKGVTDKDTFKEELKEIEELFDVYLDNLISIKALLSTMIDGNTNSSKLDCINYIAIKNLLSKVNREGIKDPAVSLFKFLMIVNTYVNRNNADSIIKNIYLNLHDVDADLEGVPNQYKNFIAFFSRITSRSWLSFFNNNPNLVEGLNIDYASTIEKLIELFETFLADNNYKYTLDTNVLSQSVSRSLSLIPGIRNLFKSIDELYKQESLIKINAKRLVLIDNLVKTYDMFNTTESGVDINTLYEAEKYLLTDLVTFNSEGFTFIEETKDKDYISGKRKLKVTLKSIYDKEMLQKGKSIFNYAMLELQKDNRYSALLEMFIVHLKKVLDDLHKPIGNVKKINLLDKENKKIINILIKAIDKDFSIINNNEERSKYLGVTAKEVFNFLSLMFDNRNYFVALLDIVRSTSSIDVQKDIKKILVYYSILGNFISSVARSKVISKYKEDKGLIKGLKLFNRTKIEERIYEYKFKDVDNTSSNEEIETAINQVFDAYLSFPKTSKSGMLLILSYFNSTDFTKYKDILRSSIESSTVLNNTVSEEVYYLDWFSFPSLVTTLLLDKVNYENENKETIKEYINNILRRISFSIDKVSDVDKIMTYIDSGNTMFYNITPIPLYSSIHDSMDADFTDLDLMINYIFGSVLNGYVSNYFFNKNSKDGIDTDSVNGHGKIGKYPLSDPYINHKAIENAYEHKKNLLKSLLASLIGDNVDKQKLKVEEIKDIINDIVAGLEEFIEAINDASDFGVAGYKSETKEKHLEIIKSFYYEVIQYLYKLDYDTLQAILTKIENTAPTLLDTLLSSLVGLRAEVEISIPVTDNNNLPAIIPQGELVQKEDTTEDTKSFKSQLPTQTEEDINLLPSDEKSNILQLEAGTTDYGDSEYVEFEEIIIEKEEDKQQSLIKADEADEDLQDLFEELGPDELYLPEEEVKEFSTTKPKDKKAITDKIETKIEKKTYDIITESKKLGKNIKNLENIGRRDLLDRDKTMYYSYVLQDAIRTTLFGSSNLYRSKDVVSINTYLIFTLLDKDKTSNIIRLHEDYIKKAKMTWKTYDSLMNTFMMFAEALNTALKDMYSRKDNQEESNQEISRLKEILLRGDNEVIIGEFTKMIMIRFSDVLTDEDRQRFENSIQNYFKKDVHFLNTAKDYVLSYIEREEMKFRLTEETAKLIDELIDKVPGVEFMVSKRFVSDLLYEISKVSLNVKVNGKVLKARVQVKNINILSVLFFVFNRYYLSNGSKKVRDKFFELLNSSLSVVDQNAKPITDEQGLPIRIETLLKEESIDKILSLINKVYEKNIAINSKNVGDYGYNNIKLKDIRFSEDSSKIFQYLKDVSESLIIISEINNFKQNKLNKKNTKLILTNVDNVFYDVSMFYLTVYYRNRKNFTALKEDIYSRFLSPIYGSIVENQYGYIQNNIDANNLKVILDLVFLNNNLRRSRTGRIMLSDMLFKIFHQYQVDKDMSLSELVLDDETNAAYQFLMIKILSDIYEDIFLNPLQNSVETYINALTIYFLFKSKKADFHLNFINPTTSDIYDRDSSTKALMYLYLPILLTNPYDIKTIFIERNVFFFSDIKKILSELSDEKSTPYPFLVSMQARNKYNRWFERALLDNRPTKALVPIYFRKQLVSASTQSLNMVNQLVFGTKEHSDVDGQPVKPIKIYEDNLSKTLLEQINNLFISSNILRNIGNSGHPTGSMNFVMSLFGFLAKVTLISAIFNVIAYVLQVSAITLFSITQYVTKRADKSFKNTYNKIFRIFGTIFYFLIHLVAHPILYVLSPLMSRETLYKVKFVSEYIRGVDIGSDLSYGERFTLSDSQNRGDISRKLFDRMFLFFYKLFNLLDLRNAIESTTQFVHAKLSLDSYAVGQISLSDIITLREMSSKDVASNIQYAFYSIKDDFKIYKTIKHIEDPDKYKDKSKYVNKLSEEDKEKFKSFLIELKELSQSTGGVFTLPNVISILSKTYGNVVTSDIYKNTVQLNLYSPIKTHLKKFFSAIGSRFVFIDIMFLAVKNIISLAEAAFFNLRRPHIIGMFSFVIFTLASYYAMLLGLFQYPIEEVSRYISNAVNSVFRNQEFFNKLITFEGISDIFNLMWLYLMDVLYYQSFSAIFILLATVYIFRKMFNTSYIKSLPHSVYAVMVGLAMYNAITRNIDTTSYPMYTPITQTITKDDEQVAEANYIILNLDKLAKEKGENVEERVKKATKFLIALKHYYSTTSTTDIIKKIDKAMETYREMYINVTDDRLIRDFIEHTNYGKDYKFISNVMKDYISTISYSIIDSMDRNRAEFISMLDSINKRLENKYEYTYFADVVSEDQDYQNFESFIENIVDGAYNKVIKDKFVYNFETSNKIKILGKYVARHIAIRVGTAIKQKRIKSDIEFIIRQDLSVFFIDFYENVFRRYNYTSVTRAINDLKISVKDKKLESYFKMDELFDYLSNFNNEEDVDIKINKNNWKNYVTQLLKADKGFGHIHALLDVPHVKMAFVSVVGVKPLLLKNVPKYEQFIQNIASKNVINEYVYLEKDIITDEFIETFSKYIATFTLKEYSNINKLIINYPIKFNLLENLTYGGLTYGTNLERVINVFYPPQEKINNEEDALKYLPGYGIYRTVSDATYVTIYKLLNEEYKLANLKLGLKQLKGGKPTNQ